MLPQACGDSVKSIGAHPAQGGGSYPTSPLHIRKEDWWVRTVDLSTVQQFIRQHHYAKGGSNTATFRHGLFRKDDPRTVLGVAWWLPPTKSAAMATFPDGDWRAVLSLSRLAIHPIVPKNAATFLLRHSVREIAKDGRFKCLVTYADEWQNHTGIIYKAAGWTYVGRTKPERTYVKDGVMVARKAGPKTRTHAEMLALGAVMVGSFSKHKYVKFI